MLYIFCVSIGVAFLISSGQASELSLKDDPAEEIDNLRKFEARGSSLFSIPVQGEIYDELSGSIGHVGRDIGIKGNGLLEFYVERQFETIPNQYPFELGTMSLRLPHLVFERWGLQGINDPSTQTCDVVTANLSEPDSDANFPQKAVVNTIVFQHETGTTELINKRRLHEKYRAIYPEEALFISKDNWILDCAPEQPELYRVQSPIGAVYYFDMDAAGERYRTNRFIGYQGIFPFRELKHALNHTYKVYATRKTLQNSVLEYTYANSPTVVAGSEDLEFRVGSPMFMKYADPLNLYDPEVQDDSISHKRRLQNVRLTSSHETSSSAEDAEVQVLNFSYRTNEETVCPGKLASVRSNTSRVRKVIYEYQEALDSNETCLLHRVKHQISVSEEYDTVWEFTYRFREGQQFVAGAGLDVLYRDSESGQRAFWYLPLHTVSTPSGTKVTYEYDLIGTCEYQQIAGPECETYSGTLGGDVDNSRPRHPVVISRMVSHAVGSAAGNQSAHTTEFKYDDPDADEVNFVHRAVTDNLTSHHLKFGLVQRLLPPVGMLYPSISDSDRRDIWLYSGRLSEYRLVNDQGEELFTVNYSYREGNSPIEIVGDGEGDLTGASTFGDSFLRRYGTVWPGIVSSSVFRADHQHLYTQRRINLHKRTINKEGYEYIKENVSFDDFNNVTQVKESTNATGAIGRDGGYIPSLSTIPLYDRTTDYVYDNDFASKTVWFVGGIKSVSVESGESKPLVNTIKYDAEGRAIEKTEAGIKTTYAYHNMGNIAAVIDTAGRSTTYRNYKYGVPRTVTDAEGVTTVSSVDQWGNVTSLSTPISNDLNYSVSYEYNDRYRRLSKTKRNGNVQDETVIYPTWTNGSPVETFRKKQVIRGNYRETTEYNHLGSVVKTTTEDIADPESRQIVTKQYDKNNRLTFQSDPSVTANYTDGTSFVYDSLGRLISSTHSDNTQSETYCYGPECNNGEFRKVNNLSIADGYAVKDPRGYVSVYNYRAIGAPGDKELVSVSQQITDSESVITELERNKVGFVRTIKQRDSGDTVERSRLYEPFTGNFTTTMRIKSEQHPEFSEKLTVENYDAVGNPTRITGHDGFVTEYIYDDVYRIKHIRNLRDDTRDINYTYFGDGSLESVTHGGASWSYLYDSNQMLISESLDIDGLETPFEIQYTYDPLMYVNVMTYPSGKVVDYDHNALGQTTSIAGYLESANYYPTGQLGYAKYSNGHHFESTLDNKSLPEYWRQFDINATPLLDYRYEYDEVGNIVSIDNYFRSETSTLNLENAIYDGLSRIINVEGEWDKGGSSLAQYRYNALGDITNKEIGDTAYGFTYNVNADGGKLSSVVSSPADIMRNREFEYDDNGNVISNGINRFYFNQMNQMTELLVNEGSVDGYKYIYDGNRKRVKTILTKYNPNTEMVSDVDATYNIYNLAGELVHEYTLSSGEVKDHIYFNGKRLATRAVHNNHDSDEDGIPDYFERLHGLPVNDPANALSDSDLDGVTDLDEYILDLFPTSATTLGAGVYDIDQVPNVPPTPPTEKAEIQPVITFLLQ
jgi:YD repeat-containing protein